MVRRVEENDLEEVRGGASSVHNHDYWRNAGEADDGSERFRGLRFIGLNNWLVRMRGYLRLSDTMDLARGQRRVIFLSRTFLPDFFRDADLLFDTSLFYNERNLRRDLS